MWLPARAQRHGMLPVVFAVSLEKAGESCLRAVVEGGEIVAVYVGGSRLGVECLPEARQRFCELSLFLERVAEVVGGHCQVRIERECSAISRNRSFQPA